MNIVKKIYTIVVLLLNILIRRRNYVLTFEAETNEIGKQWYYKFNHWGFNKSNLLMVDGADTMCEMYSNGADNVTVDVIASKKALDGYVNYDHFVSVEDTESFSWLDKILLGKDYKEDISAFKKSGSNIKPRCFWICPVTLFVLGRYPSHLYIKREQKPKWLYRLESTNPDNGLWYNSKGEYCFGIGSLKDCKTKDLPMGYDERYKANGRDWYSSCSKKEDLMHWYSLEDANELINNGFVFKKYLATEYTEYPMQTVFIKDTCLKEEVLDINELFSTK